MKSGKWIEILATAGYLGKAPKAPGTVGTLAGIPIVFVLYSLGELSYMLGAFLLCIFAIFVAEAYESKNDVHDASEIVIDEVAGYVIAMTWLPLTWQSLVGSFILFRIFDALKPFPIGWLDRKIKGGLGVVVDDVAAGMIANVILQIIFTKTNWLGYQLVL